jgi:hypothetical protein
MGVSGLREKRSFNGWDHLGREKKELQRLGPPVGGTTADDVLPGQGKPWTQMITDAGSKNSVLTQARRVDASTGSCLLAPCWPLPCPLLALQWPLGDPELRAP